MLENNNIILRDFKNIDIPKIHKFLTNKDDNLKCGFQETFKLKDSKEMILKMKNSNKNKFLGQAICYSKTSNPIGFISLKIDSKNKNAEIGLWIALEFRNKGIGKKATKLLTNYALNNLNLTLIYANIDYDNIESLKLFSSIGYIKEAKLRTRHFINNKLKDSFVYSITKNEINSQ